MSGTVYILQSLVNLRYYIGSTSDFNRRIIEHQSGKSKYTKLIKPFKVVFRQEFASIIEARRIEYKLKKLKSRTIIEKIIKDGFIKLGS
ncbi:MAG: Excinuclease ABC subunit C [Candidatus Gottesmanbacteria bacterium GW2011_GWC2_39_8]|uniref:Excinuclease ABC subunit C n=1 Tax=Candidatus Gottesmanbacteria bacterium GW2011_GWC2_39_8 TaxID=1618450 RepID=A0A0G0PTF8_9BACT|nr:MAG: Excinuclease ABC subunit C [Candidatus Gottesmanbacteria bacterium GW2011_GWC2_39_8]